MRTKLYYAGRTSSCASPLDFTFAKLSPLLGIVMRPLRKPANDNKKTTRMVAYNGGCSTTSGMVPVSMPPVVLLAGKAAKACDQRIAARLSFIDGAQVAA